MASFVESATLLLKDDASKKIDAVNKSLKQLFRTASRMKNMRIKLNVDQSSITKTERLTRAVKELTKASAAARNKTIGPRIDASAISKANQLALAIQKLNRATGARVGRPITAPVSASAVHNVRSLTTSLKELDRILARKRGAGVLPLPTVDQARLTHIRNATAALLKYARALKSLPGGAGRLAMPPVPRTRLPPTGGGAGGIGGGIFGLFAGGGGGNQGGILGAFTTGIGRATKAVLVFGATTAAVSATLRAIVEGTRERDVGETRLRLLSNNDPAIIAAVRQLTANVSAGTEGRISQGRLLEQSAELFPDIQDPKKLEVVIAELARAETAMLATGMSAAEASKGSAQLVKSLTSSNLVFDSAGGVLESFHTTMDSFIRSMVTGGADLDPQKMAAISRNMGALGKTADIVTRQFAFFLGEDVGPKAARALNQNVRQLFGGRVTPKTKDALAELGLVDNKGTIVGSKSGKNILDWTHTYLLPAFKKAGVDITDAGEVQAAIMKLGLSTSGEEAVAAVITQWDEFQRRLVAMSKVDPSQSNLNKILGESITANVNSVSEAFTSLMGTMTQSFEGQLNPALSAAASALNDLQRFIIGEPGANGKPSSGRTLGILGVAAGAGIGGLGLFKLLGAGIGSLLGTGALTTSVTANTAATAANTAALGGNTLGKVAGGAGAAAGGGLGWFGKTVAFLGTAGGVVALAVAIKEAGDKLKERIPATDTTAAGVVPPKGTIAKWIASTNPRLMSGKPLPVVVMGAGGRPTGPILPQRPNVDTLQADVNRIMEQERQVAASLATIAKPVAQQPDLALQLKALDMQRARTEMAGGATQVQIQPIVQAQQALVAEIATSSGAIETAFGVGAQAAGGALKSSVAAGGAGAGATIASQMIAAASTVGATIANAVRSAAANIHVNVNNPGGGAMPANTGAHVGGPL